MPTMRCQLLIGLAAAVSVRAAEEVLIDLDPGGLVWTGLDCDDDLALLVAFALNDSAALAHTRREKDLSLSLIRA